MSKEEGDKPEAQDAIFDRVMQMVGDRGHFQKRFNYIFNVGCVISASMVFMNIILAMNVPNHWCEVPGRHNTSFDEELWKNLTLPKDTDNRGVETHSSCEMYKDVEPHVLVEYWAQTQGNSEHNITFPYTELTNCEFGYIYDKTYYERTVPSHEDWVCEKDLYVTNTFVLNRLGELIGTFIIGQLGDTLGRRLTFYLSVVVIVAGRFMTLISTGSFVLFAVAAVIGSFTSLSIFQAPLIIAMETNDAEARGHIAMMQCMGWTVGMCILPLVFWAVRDWTWFLILTTAPSLLFLFFPKYMIESPRWLANRQKYAKCAEMLNRIAKINGKKTVHFTEESLKSYMGTDSSEPEKVYGMMSLFTNWRLGKNTLLLVIAWSISSTAYLTIVLNSSRMGGNPFLNFLWQSAMEMPAYIIGQKMSDKIGRRLTNCFSFIMSSLVCIPVILTVKNAEMDLLSTAFMVLIKFSISINFFAVNLQAMETYPTCLRQTGISIGAIAANAFGMFGPYIVFLGTNYDARYPFMILLGFFILGSITQVFLPETLHQKLPETLHEAQKFGKDQPFFHFPKPVAVAPKVEEEEMTKQNGVTEKLNQPQYAP